MLSYIKRKAKASPYVSFDSFGIKKPYVQKPNRTLLSISGKIRKKVINKEYEFTIPHFFEEMVADELEFTDIKNAITTGRIRRKFKQIPEA